MDLPTIDDDAFVAAFLRKVLDDRTAGLQRDLDEYVPLFPGREALVRSVWLDLGPAVTDVLANGRLGELCVERHIGPYRLLERLGGGGQGEVFLAEDTRLERRVAIKILNILGAGSEELRARFRREAHVASKLDHPGICGLYDVGTDGPTPYLVMPYVEGQTLAHQMQHTQTDDLPSTAVVTPAELESFVTILEGAARAVHAAHEAGVLHRDLKPANIMVTPGGDPVILDFGIARLIEGDSTYRTLTGDVFGTPSYLAPELLDTPPAPADRRTDVYSLGVTLYEAATGRRPFEAPTRDGLYRAILRGEPEDPRRVNRSISKDLAVVIATAVERDQKRRYQTALDLAEDLRRIQTRLPIRARPLGRTQRLALWVRRQPAKAAATALLLLVAMLGGVLAWKWPDFKAQADLRREASLEGHLEEGFLLLGGGNEAAIAAFERAISVNPSSAEALAGKTMALLRSGHAAEALTWIEGLDAAGRIPVSRLLRREILRELGREKEAEDLSAAGPAEGPIADFIAARWEMNSAYHGDARGFERAAELLVQCILTSPKPRALHHFVLAEAAGRSKNPVLAKTVARAILSRWSRSPTATAFAGLALVSVEPEHAIRLLERSISQRPKDHVLLCWLGDAQRALRDPAGAQRSYQRALDLEPLHLESLAGMAEALEDSGEYPRAMATYESALVAHPDVAGLSHNLGHVLLRIQDFRRAKDAFEAALRIEPTHSVAQSNLGFTFMQLGDWDRALVETEKAVRLRPDLQDARLNLGSIHWNRGETTKALHTAQEVLRAKPDLVEAHRLKARSLRDLGRLDEALESVQAACALNPFSPGALADLAEIEARRGNFVAAVEAFRRTTALPEGIADRRQDPSRAIEQCERLLSLEDTLSRVRSGSVRPADVEDIAGLARVAAARDFPAMASRLWSEAFERDAEANMMGGNRYRAATSGVLAGSGLGEDAQTLTPKDREHWRGQALVWLKADLRAWKNQVETTQAREALARRALIRYQEDPDLRRVRDPWRISLLPSHESARWQAFWADVQETLAALAN